MTPLVKPISSSRSGRGSVISMSLETIATLRSNCEKPRAIQAFMASTTRSARMVPLLPQIARFCERYPDISVTIETGNTDESLFRLFNYQADLALLGRDVSDERLISLPLRKDPMVAFVSRNHPWADRDSICLADLHDTPLVLREIGSVTRQTLEEEMSRVGFSIRPAIQV